MPRGFVAPLLVAASLLAGCEEFDPEWKLDSLRVLGIRVEPSEVRPGETFSTSALVHTPRDEPVTMRWAACLLGQGFDSGGQVGGGMGGSNTSEQASVEESPPPTCFDTEHAFPMGERTTSAGMVPLLPPGLLEGELPEVDLPPPFDVLSRLPDLHGLAVVAGFHLTVSLEVSDGTETLRANKRVMVKTVPAPGRSVGELADDEGDAEAGADRIGYGYDDETLYLDLHPGPAAATDGLLLRAYLPRHQVDADTGEPLAVPHETTTREGAVAVSQEAGVAVELTVDPATDPPGLSVAFAAEAGGFGEPEPCAGEVARADDGTLEVAVPLAALRLGAGDPLAFLVVAVRDGEVVDRAPDKGRRWLHAGPRNTDPPEPVFSRVDAGKEGPLDALGAVPGERFRIEPLPETEPWREPHLFLDFWGHLSHRREILYVSWFASTGEISRVTRFGVDPEDLEVTWTAPGAAAEGVVYAVVRDGRGGTAWGSLPVEVR